MSRIFAVIAATAFMATSCALAVAAPAKQSGTTLTGAGSTFVAPLVSQWGPAVGQAYGYELQYSPIGSGGGIAAVTNRTVDFGASDAPLSSDQFTACKGCVQIPWALSATSVIYNVQGVKNLLHMNGPTLAKIFNGDITSWNDPAIKKLNKGVALPSLKIAIVHRSDNSGTTFNFTDYLASVSPQWKSKVGTGVAVNWPTGTGARGSSGVAATVAQTPGRHRLRRRGVRPLEPHHVLRHAEPVRQVRNAGAEGHPRRRVERPEAGRDDERALHREPA